MKNKNRIEDSERKTQDMSVVADYDGEGSNRAKLVEAMGDDYEEPEKTPTGIDGKMSNFWYHYKWHVIFGTCILAFLLVGASQLMNNNPYDVAAMYVGPASIDEKGISDALTEMLTDDSNGNGKKNALITGIEYYTATRLDELIAKKKSEGASYPYYDQNANDSAYRDFQSNLYIGEYGVMFLDSIIYEDLKNEGSLVKLEDSLGYCPDEALDDYGIKLYDTKFCKYYSAFKTMPEETVLCLRAVGSANAMSPSEKAAQKTFERNKALFVDIMSFEYPEGFEPQ